MAHTFPLSIAEFANGLQIESIDFRLQHQVTSSGVGTGLLIAAQNGPDFWLADVKIRPLYHRHARALQALLNMLDGGINDFYLYDPVSAFPISDPDGTILGASTITNTDVNSNGIQMSFDGFPDGFVISPGDMFCFDYGAGSAYRGLHQIVVGGTANGSGAVSGLEFRPRLDDPDLNTGKTIDFKKAAGRFKLINESVEYGNRRDLFTSGIAFTCQQVP